MQVEGGSSAGSWWNFSFDLWYFLSERRNEIITWAVENVRDLRGQENILDCILGEWESKWTREME